MRSRFDILSRGLKRKRGEMNKVEAAYAKHLDELKASGAVHAWWFEPLTLRLSHPQEGQPARFAPDFMVLLSDGETCIDDVKSGGFDDNASLVRIKCAAEAFPLWRFRQVRKLSKKEATENGGCVWAHREM